MRAFTQHFAHHPLHLAGCGVAGLLVIVAIVFDVPVLPIVGALMCGAMMIGMAWMMLATASKGRH